MATALLRPEVANYFRIRRKPTDRHIQYSFLFDEKLDYSKFFCVNNVRIQMRGVVSHPVDSTPWAGKNSLCLRIQMRGVVVRPVTTPWAGQTIIVFYAFKCAE